MRYYEDEQTRKLIDMENKTHRFKVGDRVYIPDKNWNDPTYPNWGSLSQLDIKILKEGDKITTIDTYRWDNLPIQNVISTNLSIGYMPEDLFELVDELQTSRFVVLIDRPNMAPFKKGDIVKHWDSNQFFLERDLGQNKYGIIQEKIFFKGQDKKIEDCYIYQVSQDYVYDPNDWPFKQESVKGLAIRDSYQTDASKIVEFQGFKVGKWYIECVSPYRTLLFKEVRKNDFSHSHLYSFIFQNEYGEECVHFNLQAHFHYQEVPKPTNKIDWMKKAEDDMKNRLLDESFKQWGFSNHLHAVLGDIPVTISKQQDYFQQPIIMKKNNRKFKLITIINQ